MHELRVDLGEALRRRRDDAVDVPPPRQNLVPPRHGVPPVRRPQAPRLHHVLNQRAAVPRVLVLRPLRVGELHEDPRGLLELDHDVEQVQRGRVRVGAGVRQPPPPVQQELHRLLPALLRLRDAARVEGGVHADDVQLGRLLHLGRRGDWGSRSLSPTSRSSSTASAAASRCAPPTSRSQPRAPTD